MAQKCKLYHVRLNAGGYEYGRYGKYWGNGGAPLFRLITEDDQFEFRAADREHAKKIAAQKVPGITFYN